ncbi:hypothetical protein [Prochlorothrix hollandica]|uniref:hypothetical protein n=1 Tax=Prochlorothrix hollandica TaxID=1223 RepID=UPI00333FC26B
MTYSNQQAIGQQEYFRDVPRGEPGLFKSSGSAVIMPFVNSAGLTAPVYTITPPATVDTSKVYTLSVNGIAISVTSDGTPTTAELGLLLYNALRIQPEIFRLAQYSLNTSTGVITVTGSYFNEALTILQDNASSTTNDLTIANTVAAADGTNLGIGLAVGTLSSYVSDQYGRFPAKAISHATNFTFRGFSAREIVEPDRVGPLAEPMFKPGQVFGVVTDVGTREALLVQCVEATITPANSAYIAISGTNAGKVTSSSSGTMNVSSRVSIVSDSFTANGKNLVYVYYSR